MAKKRTWTLRKDKRNGQIVEFLNYWEKNSLKNEDVIFFKPEPFKDKLTYMGYNFCASGIEVHWRSTIHGKVITNMELLDNALKQTDKTECRVLDMKPLVIEGEFDFVKRGSSLRIIEITKYVHN